MTDLCPHGHALDTCGLCQPIRTDPYIRKATINRVIDGDTVYLDVDLGYRVTVTHSFRFNEIDTPEIRGAERPEGLVAKQLVIEWFNEHSDVWVTSDKGKRSFNRYIALDIVCRITGESLFDVLRAAGYEKGKHE